MSDPHQEWLKRNPGQIPAKIEEDLPFIPGSEGVPREMIRQMIEDDPDLFGDWDAFDDE